MKYIICKIGLRECNAWLEAIPQAIVLANSVLLCATKVTLLVSANYL